MEEMDGLSGKQQDRQVKCHVKADYTIWDRSRQVPGILQSGLHKVGVDWMSQGRYGQVVSQMEKLLDI
jgi:hypothetical protein